MAFGLTGDSFSCCRKEEAALESAAAAASDVTAAMMAVKIELNEKKRTNDLLQRALVSKAPQGVLQLACRTGVIVLRILGEQRRKPGEDEARIARKGKSAKKYFALASFSPLFTLQDAKTLACSSGYTTINLPRILH